VVGDTTATISTFSSLLASGCSQISHRSWEFLLAHQTPLFSAARIGVIRQFMLNSRAMGGKTLARKLFQAKG